MREIKFRAKRLDNGEWVYGSYLVLPENLYKETDTFLHYIVDINGNQHLVDPNTIGQFTGLYDKNGKEIYGGDIVRIGQLAWLREIIWHNNSWKTRAIPEKCVQEYLNDHPKEKLECEKGYIEEICWIRDDETHYDLIDSEIIGNVHDNPELLK